MPTSDGPRMVITPDDHAALIVVVTAIAVSWTFSVLIIRVVSKVHVKARLGFEEVAIVLASLVATASSVSIFAGVKYGLGRKDPGQRDDALKAAYAADILYIFALGISKYSALELVKKLTPVRMHIMACYVFACLIGCWTVASVIIIAVRCTASTPWIDDSNTTCSGLFTRWGIVEGLSITIEVAIFVLCSSIIYILQMRWKVKVKVLFAFATRLPIVIPTILRLVYLKEGLSSTDDPLFALTNAVIATQVVLHLTVMAASFAYLKPFLSAFDSNLGATVKVDTVVSTYYAGKNSSKSKDSHAESQQVSYALSSMDTSAGAPYSHKKWKKKPELYGTETVDLGPFPDEDQYDTEIADAVEGEHNSSKHSSKGSRPRNDSSDSKVPIITKTQEFSVHTEARTPDFHAI